MAFRFFQKLTFPVKMKKIYKKTNLKESSFFNVGCDRPY